MPAETIVHHYPAQLSSLRAILKQVTEGARKANLGEQAVFHCKLAVDEAATNIIEHAYEGADAQGVIGLEMIVLDGECTIHLVDSGTPFNVTAVPEPDLTAPLEGRQGGGLGLFLMRTVMDEVHYTPGPPQNRLVMIKRRS